MNLQCFDDDDDVLHYKVHKQLFGIQTKFKLVEFI